MSTIASVEVQPACNDKFGKFCTSNVGTYRYIPTGYWYSQPDHPHF